MATSAFGKAFRAAREAGDKEFEFGGKKYNTKMKDEDSAPAKKEEPKASQEFPKTPAPKYDDSSDSKPKKGIGPYGAFSGVGDYLDKTFTMEGREQAKKEAKEKFGMKKGGSVSASSRADGIAQRGKTRGKMC
tara:strand:+ start:46 stop:444 length:399 start_codon:yes stop_codon:yes gene_type:complete